MEKHAYVIIMTTGRYNGRYVQTVDGGNNFVLDIRLATKFPSEEDAECHRPGHTREMGGSGIKGRIVRYQDPIENAYYKRFLRGK